MCLSLEEKAYHRVAIVTSFLSWQQLIFVTQVWYSSPRQLINQLCSGFLAAKKRRNDLLEKLSNAHHKVFLLCLRILNVFFFPLRTPERRNNRGRLRPLNCREEEGGFDPKRVGSTLSILLKITEK